MKAAHGWNSHKAISHPLKSLFTLFTLFIAGSQQYQPAEQPPPKQSISMAHDTIYLDTAFYYDAGFAFL
ncbi:MAG: hypothetical protein ABSA13_02825 [Beijerinckiaceae bacterium]